MIKRGVTTKISVTLPAELVEQVRLYVETGEFSAFCSAAIRNHLAYLRQREGLSRSYGAWKGTDHPDLASPGDAAEYVRKLRKSDTARTARVMDK